jgi:nucleoside-diphosphate-sugar epimerase
MLTNNPTLVVLGGTGFVGRHVIVEAVASGRHVKALARSEESERTLSGMSAMPFRGEADDPSKWIHEADGAHAIIDLIQPKLPNRLGRSQLTRISEQRQRFTKALVDALRTLPQERRPTLISVSGIDDLAPDRDGFISSASPLRANHYGFSPIGVPVRRIIERSGLCAAFIYLGTVYGPGKAFAETIFPRVAAGTWKNFGTDRDRMILIHVEDAAREIVHVADSDASQVAGRSFIVTDGKPIAMSSFFGKAAHVMNVKAPGRVPRWLAAIVAGRPLVEATTSTLSVRSSIAESQLLPLRYPSYLEGLPPTLKALGYSRVS